MDRIIFSCVSLFSLCHFVFIEPYVFFPFNKKAATSYFCAVCRFFCSSSTEKFSLYRSVFLKFIIPFNGKTSLQSIDCSSFNNRNFLMSCVGYLFSSRTVGRFLFMILGLEKKLAWVLAIFSLHPFSRSMVGDISPPCICVV